MKNKEVSQILYEIADFLEIKDVDFKPRAYRRAAHNIEALTEDIEEIHNRGDLREIDGVGKAISEKISEYLETGKLEYYENLKNDLPVKIEELTSIEGVGPKSVKKLYDNLDVRTIEELETAAEEGKVAKIKGFGEKVQKNILENIEAAKKGKERELLGKIDPLVQDMKERLQSKNVYEKLEVVGSYRRGKSTIGDIDILAVADDKEEGMEKFCTLEDVERVLERGETKSSVILSDGVQMDLRLIEKSSYGAGLMYFTGSKDHNVSLRKKAIERDWKLNEYGLYNSEDEKLAGETEKEVYEKLDMSFIPPELRENTGEIEAAEKNELPNLVKKEDIKGDLQTHSNYSDGSVKIEEMAKKAMGKGLEYILISDHAPSLKVAGGLDEEEFEEQGKEINEVNDELEIEVLWGIEANINENGLDIPIEWCKKLDLVCVAIHDKPENPTERILSVFDNYPVDILVHPRSRRMFSRDPLDLDLDKITKKAQEENIALEINAQPDRLDLDWQNVKKYQDRVKYVISTDAHSTVQLDFLRLGVSQARRGWCEQSNILNTQSIEDVRSYFDG